MRGQGLMIEERLVARVTSKRSIGRVRMFVSLQLALHGEALIAKPTEILREFIVRKHYVLVKCFLIAENDVAHEAHLRASVFQVKLLVERAPRRTYKSIALKS